MFCGYREGLFFGWQVAASLPDTVVVAMSLRLAAMAPSHVFFATLSGATRPRREQALGRP